MLVAHALMINFSQEKKMNIFCKYIKPIKIIMTWMWCVATSFKNFFFSFFVFCHLLRRSNNVCFTSFLSFVQFWPNFSNSFFGGTSSSSRNCWTEINWVDNIDKSWREMRFFLCHYFRNSKLHFRFEIFQNLQTKKSGILARKFELKKFEKKRNSNI